MREHDYMYHYTSIDTLELILKNKTIRFNSLENVDDKEEKMTADMGNFGKYFFASCWTHQRKENEDLWKRYGKDGLGIRLKLHKYPFKTYYISGENVRKPFWSYIDGPIKEDYMVLIYGVDDPTNTLLKKVKYTEDESLLFPKIKYENASNYVLCLNKIGIYKRNSWDVQQEWRYIFPIVPVSKREFELGMYSIKDAISSGRDLGIDYYDLLIDEKYLKEVEILMGPNTSLQDFIRVKEFGNEYNVNIKVKKSTCSTFTISNKI